MASFCGRKARLLIVFVRARGPVLEDRPVKLHFEYTAAQKRQNPAQEEPPALPSRRNRPIFTRW